MYVLISYFFTGVRSGLRTLISSLLKRRAKIKLKKKINTCAKLMHIRVKVCIHEIAFTNVRKLYIYLFILIFIYLFKYLFI